MEDLQRFLTAQDGKRGNTSLYELALKEIKEGKPDFECWVRYVYPQLKRSGTSKLTDFYGLNGREEAKIRHYRNSWRIYQSHRKQPLIS